MWLSATSHGIAVNNIGFILQESENLITGDRSLLYEV